MMLTIAIPSYNRLKYLKANLDAALALNCPRQLDIRFRVSAASSNDGTIEYLRETASHDKRLDYFKGLSTRTRWNWIYLGQTIPRETEWVWLFGDDDIFCDRDALHVLYDFLKRAEETKAAMISIPQAKRISNTDHVEIETLANLSGKYGIHEIFGWMTSIILKRELYLNLIDTMRVRFRRIYTDTGLRKARLSPFFHTLTLLEQNSNAITMLVFKKIVDEQALTIESNAHKKASREREHLRDRLPFTFSDFKKTLDSIEASNEIIFFRYVNKTFLDLYINIIAENILEKRNPTLTLLQLNELDYLIEKVGSKSRRVFTQIAALLRNCLLTGCPPGDTMQARLREVMLYTKEPYLGDFIGTNTTINSSNSSTSNYF